MNVSKSERIFVFIGVISMAVLKTVRFRSCVPSRFVCKLKIISIQDLIRIATATKCLVGDLFPFQYHAVW